MESPMEAQGWIRKRIESELKKRTESEQNRNWIEAQLNVNGVAQWGTSPN